MMKNNQAFTLIELLVVVLIIGILAAVALPQYQRAVDKTKMTNLVTLAESIKKAQDVYYLDNGSYADTLSTLDISFNFPGVSVEARSGNKDWLYLYGNTYMPGILLIVPYTHNTMTGVQRSCHANSSNERAIAACKHACQTTSLVTDGMWKACNF